MTFQIEIEAKFALLDLIVPGASTRLTGCACSVAAPWLGSLPVQTQLHRWRYSLPLRVHPERCVVLREPAPLVFAGDAFGGPRVEGAALSGLAADAALAELLNGTLPS